MKNIIKKTIILFILFIGVFSVFLIDYIPYSWMVSYQIVGFGIGLILAMIGLLSLFGLVAYIDNL